jgi:riboflavin biosynthesis pyrimidine reductase
VSVDWGARFERFVARKHAQASAAVLSPLVTDETRDVEGLAAIGNGWSRALFDGSFFMSPAVSDAVPATNLVFVQSASGNTGARNPSVLGGGEVDKHVIYEGLSRVAADAVMSGASTVRSANLILSTWHPELVALRSELGLPRHPVQVIATLRGVALDRTLLFNVPEVRVVLLTVPRTIELLRDQLEARPWIVPVAMADPAALREAFGELRRVGIRRMSCIGGRTLARELINAGLVQDLYLTTSATEAGEPNTPIYPVPLDGALVVRKHGTGADAGVVFEHTRLAP